MHTQSKFRRTEELQSGFAFPDLLLTVAGLLLVVAVLTPFLLKNRAESRRLVCTSNLKQVNAAMLKYAEERNGVFPRDNNPQKPIWWWYKRLAKDYVGANADKVFACPGDRGYDEPSPEKPAPFWTLEKFDNGSYNFNAVNLPGVPHIAGRSIASIREPNKTLLMMEWTAHGPLSWHRSKTGSKNYPFYNNAESVVGFVDGHVDLVKIQFDGINAAYTRDPGPGYAYKYSGD
jgi:hypothetical protein